MVVIGAGTVGAAIAYGLVRRGLRVLLLDGGDRDFRAAAANFGLIWQSGKGMDMPAYQRLTRESVELWPDYCAELEQEAGIDLQYDRVGGLTICLGEAEFEQRRAIQMRLHNQIDTVAPESEMLDRAALERLLPCVRLGDEVTGASLGHKDGHANPLRLLASLHSGFVRLGGQFRGGAPVRTIASDGRGTFAVDFAGGRVSAGRVVIAAGLGTKALAAQVNLDIPIRAQRGQILVTERVEPILPLPMSGLRQTREGTVMMGVTHEEAGLDASTTVAAAAALSANAMRRIPALGELKLVRQWAGLRIMTPDGHPIYAESPTHPGAFVALCHSGITLAATHSRMLAQAIADGRLPPELDDFHHRRFDVPQAA